VAFVPLLGIWIVLFEAVGKSGWYSLLPFVPYVGGLVLLLWTAESFPRITVARAGGRSCS